MIFFGENIIFSILLISSKSLWYFQQNVMTYINESIMLIVYYLFMFIIIFLRLHMWLFVHQDWQLLLQYLKDTN